MTNNAFMEKYLLNDNYVGACNHLMCHHNELVNYSTTLCEIDRDNHVAHFNTAKYSTTTSKIQSSLAYLLSKYGFEIVEYKGEPCTYWNYGQMGAPTWKRSDLMGF